MKSLKKLEEKCDDFEKQTESEFREKLKLSEALKASEETRERATSEASRLKEQVKEYKGLYEANVKDAVVRRNSLEKKSLQNQELHKKYSKQAMKLSEVCVCGLAWFVHACEILVIRYLVIVFIKLFPQRQFLLPSGRGKYGGNKGEQQ